MNEAEVRQRAFAMPIIFAITLLETAAVFVVIGAYCATGIV